MLKPQPIENMSANVKEVTRLMDIHAQLTGRERGRRYDVEILNKSSIVLITACWEALVEDLASDGFDFMLKHAEDSAVFPAKVRALASRKLKAADDETKIWDLSGEGWRKVLATHRDRTIASLVGSLNTPRAENVDRMFRDILGISKVSSSWYWGRLGTARAREKLDEYVALRGAIAHRVSTSGSVTKAGVSEFRDFAFRLAVKTSNRVNNHIFDRVGERPWSHWQFGSVE